MKNNDDVVVDDDRNDDDDPREQWRRYMKSYHMFLSDAKLILVKSERKRERKKKLGRVILD